MSRRFIPPPTTTWKPKSSSNQSINKSNELEKSNEINKIQQKQIETKEIKETIHKPSNSIKSSKEIKTNQINDISNKLLDCFKEMLDNITILSNKTVELEEQNNELQKQIDREKQNDEKFDKLLERLNSIEVQSSNQQKLIDHFTILIDGKKTNENQKEDWIKQDKERIEQLMKEMKMTEEEMEKRAHKLKKRRKEAEKYVEEQKKMRNEMNAINKQVNECNDKINNQSEVIGTNQEVLERHDNQFDEIWNEMEIRKREIEEQINNNKTLDVKEKKMMKDEIYCELVEETKKQIKELKQGKENEGKKREEGLIERMMKLENQIKTLEIEKSESKMNITIPENILKKEEMTIEIDNRMKEFNNKIEEEKVRYENKSNEIQSKMNEIEMEMKKEIESMKKIFKENEIEKKSSEEMKVSEDFVKKEEMNMKYNFIEKKISNEVDEMKKSIDQKIENIPQLIQRNKQTEEQMKKLQERQNELEGTLQNVNQEVDKKIEKVREDIEVPKDIVKQEGMMNEINKIKKLINEEIETNYLKKTDLPDINKLEEKMKNEMKKQVDGIVIPTDYVKQSQMNSMKNEVEGFKKSIDQKIVKVKEDIVIPKDYVKRKELSDEIEKMEKVIDEKTARVYVKKSEIDSLVTSKKNGMMSKHQSSKASSSSHDLHKNQIKQLEKWTGLQYNSIVFDSNIDDWKENTSVFDEKIMGKKQIVFLIEDEDGEKFGYYLNTQITNEKYAGIMPRQTDSKSFEFNLQSNGRLKQPMKFEIRNINEGYKVSEKSSSWLISLGDIILLKENMRHESYCWQYEDKFNYHGVEKALCGKKIDKIVNQRKYGTTFTPKRILVLQMK